MMRARLSFMYRTCENCSVTRSKFEDFSRSRAESGADVDGALVGGASLKASDFGPIVAALAAA